MADETPAAPPAALPFDVEAWRARFQASRDIIAPRIDQGKRNVKQYRNKTRNVSPRSDEVSVPLDYTFTEQKRPQIFYQVPEVQLTGKTPEADATSALFQAVLNDFLGPSKINIRTAMDEILFDIICAVGYGVIKCGYENRTQPVPQTDPATGQPMLDANSQPVMIKGTVWERWFGSRIPPGFFRFPCEFHGSDFDDASWVAFRFYEDAAKDDSGATTGKQDDDDLLLSNAKRDGTKRYTQPRKWGTECWYRTTMDERDADPFAQRMFVLMDNEETPRAHADSPYQSKRPDGSLAGVLGFPIKVATLRYVSDSALPPSDCEITRNLIDEISKGRTQMLRGRDRRLPQTAVDSTIATTDFMAKVEKNEQNGFLPIPGLRADMFVAIEKGAIPPENPGFNDAAERDVQGAWAMGANQVGSTTRTTRTATETQTIQNSTDTRLDYERGKMGLFFCHKIATTFAALIQMFADKTDYVRMLGPSNEQVLAPWSRQLVQGDFEFSIKINSQLRPDNSSDMQKWQNWMNIAGPSPFVNQKVSWESYAKAMGVWTPGMIVDPPPPAPETKPPTQSVSMPIEKLALIAPEAAAMIIQKTMQDMGIQHAPLPQIAGMLPPNPTTDTTTEQTPVLSKHEDDLTGRMPGNAAVVQDLTGGNTMAVQ